MAIRSEFLEEQTNIVKTLLTNRYFNPWREYKKFEYDENFDKSLINESKLEIYVTAKCNQKCDYCYLVKHKELYPAEFDKKELILKNLNILIDWIIENNFYIPTIEIFSGEIWHTNFGLDILEIIYQGIQKGLQTNMVLIPSNCSFILDKIQTQKIQHCINKFEKIGVRLCFSISVDGKIIENFRPLNSSEKEKNDLFYDNLFLFAEHNNFHFHPMVSAKNINKWIENYLWFEEMFYKYNLNIETIMMLEVRNNDWDEKSIQEYKEFLDFLINKKLKYHKTIDNFFNYLFNFDNSNETPDGYLPYALPFAYTFQGCTVSDNLTVRLGDLAICPCHRTAYNKLLYGHFIVKDNKIIDIEGNNPEIASRILLANNNIASLNCDVCKINKFCLKGCFGSQYETEKDMFFPIQSVCNLFLEKYDFLIKKYTELGIIDYLKKISPYNMHYNQAQELLKFIQEYNKDVG